MNLTKERFPAAVEVVREVFGADATVVEDPEVCTKCGLRFDEPFRHLPAELGGGCIDLEDPTCPMCGGFPGFCSQWCELARLR
jgi:hypothetical protein